MNEKNTELYVLYRDDQPMTPLFEIYESDGARRWLVQLSGIIHEERFTTDWSVAEIARHFIRYWFDPVRVVTLESVKYDRPRVVYRDQVDKAELKRIKSELETAILAEQKELFA